MTESAIDPGKPFSFIAHAAHLYDVSEVLDEGRVAYFAAANCPANLDREKAVKAAVFIYTYRPLFDAAILDAVELNVTNYQLDKLVALLDKLFLAYASGEKIDELLHRMQRLLNRYYVDKLPIWYCWYLIRHELLYTYDGDFVPGMQNAQVEAAITKRHTQLTNKKEAIMPNSDPRIGDAIVRLNKAEKQISELTGKLADTNRIIADFAQKFDGVSQSILGELRAIQTAAQAPQTAAQAPQTAAQAPQTAAQAPQTAADPFQSAIAGVLTQAGFSPDKAAQMVADVADMSQATQPAHVPTIGVAKQLTREERQAAEYADFLSKVCRIYRRDGLIVAVEAVKQAITEKRVDAILLVNAVFEAYKDAIGNEFKTNRATALKMSVLMSLSPKMLEGIDGISDDTVSDTNKAIIAFLSGKPAPKAAELMTHKNAAIARLGLTMAYPDDD